jgi:hypothetical protein
VTKRITPLNKGKTTLSWVFAFTNVARADFELTGFATFSGVMLTVLFSKSKSVHLSMKASPHRIPVSLSNWRNAEVFLLQPAIRLLISASVGIKGSFWTD